jgi:hypothetical protein
VHPYLLETEDQLTKYISSARPGFPVERIRACVQRWILYFARQEVGIPRYLDGGGFGCRVWTVKACDSEEEKDSERWGIWMMARAKVVTIGQFHKAIQCKRDEADVRHKSGGEMRMRRQSNHAPTLARR